jgi:hypothetical protein
MDAALINTAFRAERHAQLAQRWLAREADSMTPADRLSYSREVARASEARDKAIAALDLPKPTIVNLGRTIRFQGPLEPLDG